MTRPSTRRDRNAEATRRTIIQAGRELFAIEAYSDVTGAQICDRAGVTRGALQHHFGNKSGLFMAVFEGLQSEVVTRIRGALTGNGDPWEQAWASIVAFLDGCIDPEYQAVVLKQAPAALGWQRWRERYRDYFADVVHELIGAFDAAGLVKHSPVMFTALVRGGLTELSFQIARSSDQTQARADALAVLDELMSMFRQLASGPPHPGATSITRTSDLQRQDSMSSRFESTTIPRQP